MKGYAAGWEVGYMGMWDYMGVLVGVNPGWAADVVGLLDKALRSVGMREQEQGTG